MRELNVAAADKGRPVTNSISTRSFRSSADMIFRSQFVAVHGGDGSGASAFLYRHFHSRHLVPTRWQSSAELTYEFIANM